MTTATLNGTLPKPSVPDLKKVGQLGILAKTEKRPGGGEISMYKYTLDDFPIKGGQQWDAFIYGAKYEGVSYQKIYIDIDGKVLIGKQDEMTPWVTLCAIGLIQRVQL